MTSVRRARSDPQLDLGALRVLAVGVAYRMLGSRTEAEDVAQEALVRIDAAAGTTRLRNPEAFTTTVTTRLALDHLRRARVRRVAYVGPWLPEPVGDDPAVDGPEHVELGDSLSFALLTMLETLGPAERAAFLLHDVFGYGYQEVAAVLGRTEVASRQLVSRGRRRLQAGRPRREVDPDEHRRILERFLAACRGGDLDALVAVLAEDAVLVSDGGAEVRAARHPIVGRARVARFLRVVGPSVLAHRTAEVVRLNGEPAVVVSSGGQPVLACTLETDAGRVLAVRWVLNPDKLRWVGPLSAAGGDGEGEDGEQQHHREGDGEPGDEGVAHGSGS